MNENQTQQTENTPDVTPYAVALYPFKGELADELSFDANDIVLLITHIDDQWIKGEIDGKAGIFPASYVSVEIDCPRSDLNAQKNTLDQLCNDHQTMQRHSDENSDIKKPSSNTFMTDQSVHTASVETINDWATCWPSDNTTNDVPPQTQPKGISSQAQPIKFYQNIQTRGNLNSGSSNTNFERGLIKRGSVRKSLRKSCSFRATKVAGNNNKSGRKPFILKNKPAPPAPQGIRPSNTSLKPLKTDVQRHPTGSTVLLVPKASLSTLAGEKTPPASEEKDVFTDGFTIFPSPQLSIQENNGDKTLAENLHGDKPNMKSKDSRVHHQNGKMSNKKTPCVKEETEMGANVYTEIDDETTDSFSAATHPENHGDYYAVIRTRDMRKTDSERATSGKNTGSGVDDKCNTIPPPLVSKRKKRWSKFISTSIVRPRKVEKQKIPNHINRDKEKVSRKSFPFTKEDLEMSKKGICSKCCNKQSIISDSSIKDKEGICTKCSHGQSILNGSSTKDMKGICTKCSHGKSLPSDSSTKDMKGICTKCSHGQSIHSDSPTKDMKGICTKCSHGQSIQSDSSTKDKKGICIKCSHGQSVISDSSTKDMKGICIKCSHGQSILSDSSTKNNKGICTKYSNGQSILSDSSIKDKKGNCSKCSHGQSVASNSSTKDNDCIHTVTKDVKNQGREQEAYKTIWPMTGSDTPFIPTSCKNTVTGVKENFITISPPPVSERNKRRSKYISTSTARLGNAGQALSPKYINQEEDLAPRETTGLPKDEFTIFQSGLCNMVSNCTMISSDLSIPSDSSTKDNYCTHPAMKGIKTLEHEQKTHEIIWPMNGSSTAHIPTSSRKTQERGVNDQTMKIPPPPASKHNKRWTKFIST